MEEREDNENVVGVLESLLKRVFDDMLDGQRAMVFCGGFWLHGSRGIR